MLYNLPIELFDLISTKLIAKDKRRIRKRNNPRNRFNPTCLTNIIYNNPETLSINPLYYYLLIDKDYWKYKENIRSLSQFYIYSYNLDNINFSKNTQRLIKKILKELLSEINLESNESDIEYMNRSFEDRIKSEGIFNLRSVYQLLFQIGDLVYKYPFDIVIKFYDILDLSFENNVSLMSYFYDFMYENLSADEQIYMFNNIDGFIHLIFQIKYLDTKSSKITKISRKIYNHFSWINRNIKGTDSIRLIKGLNNILKSEEDKKFLKSICNDSLDIKKKYKLHDKIDTN